MNNNKSTNNSNFVNNQFSKAKASKKLTFSLLATAMAGLVSLPAAADKYRDYNAHQNTAFDYAKVTHVTPRIETYEVNRPIEQCWDEKVPVRSRNYDRQRRSDRASNRHNTKTPEIVGAIIGGIIGNQVGKRGGGKARDVATVAGAVLGGSIGHDTKQRNRRHNDRYNNRYNNHYNNARYETVQRCELKDSYVIQEQIVGYDVEYKYRGNVFHTQMPQHPGKKIKVKVTVNPV